MKRNNDYLSEFEREFESDDAFSEASFESDDSEEGNSEWASSEDSEDAYEMSDDNEFESDDQAYEDWSDSNGERAREREFEDRLYQALNSGVDNEFELEMELNRVLHEMEQDYFFGSFKRLINKHGPGVLKKIAGSAPFGKAMKAISKHGRGLIRRAMDSQLLKSAAQFIPGAGPVISKGMDIAGQMMNSEVAGVSRAQVQQAVQVGKQAYQNLAGDLVKMRDPNTLPDLGKQALQRAVATHGNQFKGKKKTVFPLRIGSIVTVHPHQVVIWQS